MQTKSKQSNFSLAENTQLNIKRLSIKQQGITLIELTVAMAVSSIIMLGISNIYLSTKKSHVIHDEFARLQENIRYSGNTLALEIRNSGYFGCAAGQDPDSIKNGLIGSENIALNLETGIFGFDAAGSDIGNNLVFDPTVRGGVQGNWVTAAGLTVKTQDNLGAQISIALNPAIDPLVLARATPGSDILILRGAQGTGIKVAKQNTSAQVFLDDTTGGFTVGSCPTNPPGQRDGISGLCPEDILMITDCESARIFKAKTFSTVGACATPCFNLTHNAAGNAPGENKPPVAWSGKDDVFKEDAEVMKVVTKTFFIGLPAPIPGGLPTEPTLFVQNNDGTPDPLVEGVENMQILYGVDTDVTPGNPMGDGIANQYFSVQNIPNLDGNTDTIFEGVVSVKLSLLVRTPQDMPGINRTVADYANLTYPMISPATPITIDPIPVDAASTDRRMRKVLNLTIKLRNK